MNTNLLNGIKRIGFSAIILTLSCQFVNAQFNQDCAIGKLIRYPADYVPSLHQSQENNNAETREANGEVIYIQTVVHVVYHSEEDNFDDEFVEGILEQVNKVFRKEVDTLQILPALRAVAADSRIQFCLAKITPDGLPTTGITHTQTEVSYFPDISPEPPYIEAIKESSEGGVDAWNTDQYLNIWIGRTTPSELGISYGIPWPNFAPLADLLPVDSVIQGIVLDVDGFVDPGGTIHPDHAASTLAHEVGHVLGLRHTHGDPPNLNQFCEYDDLMEDTPICAFNFDAACGEVVNSCTEPVDDKPDNLSNIMGEACMLMITQMQAEQMYQNVTNHAPGLIADSQCTPTEVLTASFEATTSNSICEGASVSFEYTGYGATAYAWVFEGANPAISVQESPTVVFNQPGVYDVQLTVSNGTEENSLTQEGLITVLPQPTAVITVNNPASSSSANDGSLQVEVFDGVPPYTFTLMPANVSNTTGLFEGLAPGEYVITVANLDAGCSVELPVSIDLASSVTVAEKLLSQVSISPNPSSNGIFNVFFEKPFPSPVELSLLDLVGRPIHKEIIPANANYHKTWEMPELPNGIYFLKIKTEGYLAAKKVILK